MFHENLQNLTISCLPYFSSDFQQIFTVLFENFYFVYWINLNLDWISPFNHWIWFDFGISQIPVKKNRPIYFHCIIKFLIINPLKTSPEYTRAGVYGKCVLKENQIVFNGLKIMWSIGKGSEIFRDYIPICLISTWKHIMYA